MKEEERKSIKGAKSRRNQREVIRKQKEEESEILIGVKEQHKQKELEQ